MKCGVKLYLDRSDGLDPAQWFVIPEFSASVESGRLVMLSPIFPNNSIPFLWNNPQFRVPGDVLALPKHRD